MIFHSPPRSSGLQPGKLGVHARIKVRLPIEKKVISEVKDEKDKPGRGVPRKPNGWSRPPSAG
jgi:DNA-directed RNA polymerase subunit beta'